MNIKKLGLISTVSMFSVIATLSGCDWLKPQELKESERVLEEARRKWDESKDEWWAKFRKLYEAPYESKNVTPEEKEEAVRAFNEIDEKWRKESAEIDRLCRDKALFDSAPLMLWG